MATRLGAFFLALTLSLVSIQAQPRATAIFAGGCFWCMEPPFEKLKGVVSVTSGYTGGTTKNPTYEEVSNGGTGHYEAVVITYDPRQVSYAALVGVFWRNVDPLDANGQFCDKGDQYRAAIFYRNAAERQLAEQSKRKIEQARRWKIVTEILPAAQFYRAEEYHQDYYKKNPVRYKFYRFNCGRDNRLRTLWGDA
jgi:peptide-methionine (S)-S-oxide reductase